MATAARADSALETRPDVTAYSSDSLESTFVDEDHDLFSGAESEDETQIGPAALLESEDRRSDQIRTNGRGQTESVVVSQSVQLGVTSDGAGPSDRTRVEAGQPEQAVTENPVEGASNSASDRQEDGDDDSQSLFQDLPPRTSSDQLGHRSDASHANVVTTNSPSHQRMLGQIPDNQSEPVLVSSPSNQSQPILVQNNARTNQSAPQDDEEASEVMHAPHQRRRPILDSHDDEGEVPQLVALNLSEILTVQSNAVVVSNPAEIRANRRRVITPVGYDDDTDDEGDDDDDNNDIDVIDNSDTDDEPMEVEGASSANPAAPTELVSVGAAPAVPAGRTPVAAPLEPAPVEPAPTASTPAQRVEPHSTVAAFAVVTTEATRTSAAPVAPATSTAPTNDSLQDFKSPKRIPMSSKTAIEEDSDDDSQTCIICYEPWTNSGSHRLASLKCGHLFGHSCILKWLKQTNNLKCPQCNAKAKKTDVRVIYAKSLRTIDTSEKDRALDDLRKEKEMRRKAEIDVAQANLRYRMAIEEMNRLKEQINSQRNQLRNASSAHQSSSSASGQSASSNSHSEGSSAPRGQYALDKTIQISQNGNCRVMGFDQFHSALVISMPSPNPLFPGFGVKKVSANDLRCTQYVPIHTAMIRALAFNGRNDGNILTASTDKTLKITSLISNAVVQTYKTDASVWSCAWNSADVNYIYAGLQNGAILVYDTRQVNGEVQRLTFDNSRCPIVSLTYVPKAADQNFGCSGLLMASLGGMSFWEQTSDNEFKPHLLQMDGICTSLSFNNRSRHCLASFRPNKNHSSTRHVMCELRNERNTTASTNEVTCYPIQTFYGGPTMKVLTRSILYQSPDKPDQFFACSGDEATSSALIWDTTSGSQVQKLTINSTVLDVCPFQFNRQSFLAALTDKQVKLYTWRPTKQT